MRFFLIRKRVTTYAMLTYMIDGRKGGIVYDKDANHTTKWGI